MDEHTHTDDPTPESTETVAPVATATQPAVVIRSTEPDRRSFGFGSFLAGFLSAILLAAFALAVFLVVSDSDDDGDIRIEVPAVDVDTGG